ncbi:MAG: MBL fold metallo-hydrolase [bacterium]|nr:MBL fold metallo-hydrolase [bacterium]
MLHQGESGFEVLMVRRSSTARFMAGAWAFPGGVVDPEDHEDAALQSLAGTFEPELGPWLAAAFREVVEETGVWLTDPVHVEPLGKRVVFDVALAESRRFAVARSAYFANWITPTMVPVRFDARFFIVGVDHKVVPIPDEREVDAAEFVSPHEALRRAEAGNWLVPFPTQRTLHQLAKFASVDAALGEWQNRTVVSVQPRMRVADDGSLEVVMPGDPGFDDLEDVAPDPAALADAARAAAKKGHPVAEVAPPPATPERQPRVELVRAPNPGPYTGPGTNSYVIESGGEALVLDPGPVIPVHLDAICVALSGFTPVGVVVTHTHPDHAPAANGLGRELDVPVYGFACGDEFEPTVRIDDGSSIPFGESQLISVHTPGHTADHVCFRLGEYLFTGDHIMGGSTVIIEDAAAYMVSLEKVAALEPDHLYPGHGPELPEAREVIAEYIAHRVERERQVMAAVSSGARTIAEVVEVVYAGLDSSLQMAAVMQVHTQLIKLKNEGRVSLGSGGVQGSTTVRRVEKSERWPDN